MGYENARSTILLATHCLCCGRALRDPMSVESGVGPICRDKYGYSTEGNPETRELCSKLIHAAAQPGLSATDIYAFADKIEELGFDGVATRVRERFARAYEWETEKKAAPLLIKREKYTIRGTTYEDAIFLHTPFEKTSTKAFNDAFREAIPGADRTGTKVGNTFWWVIAPSHAHKLHGVLLAHFDGRLLKSDKGNTIIGEAEKAAKEEQAEAASKVAQDIIAKFKAEQAAKEVKVETPEPVVAAVSTTPAVTTSQPVPVPSSNSDMGEDWGDFD